MYSKSQCSDSESYCFLIISYQARKQWGYKVTLRCCHGGLTQIAQLNGTAVSRTSPRQQMDESSVHVPRRILNWLRATLFLQVSN